MIDDAMDAVAALELRVVDHRMFRDAAESMQMLLARARYETASAAAPDVEGADPGSLKARALLVRGAPGSGKSTLVQYMYDRNKPRRGPDGLSMPVAMAEIPPAPTLRAVSDAMYASLGYRAEARASMEDIVQDLASKTKLLGLRVMMIDEGHHILASRERAIVTEFIKSLLNRVRCSLIISGLDDLKELRSSLQLGRRLEPDVELRPYSFTNTAERLEFLIFLGSLEKNALTLPEPSNLVDQNTALRLYVATGGLIGIVTKYLSRAVLLCKVRNLSRIDLPLLAEIDATWTDAPRPPADIKLTTKLDLKKLDVAELLKEVKRVRLDAGKNPFLCEEDALEGILEERTRMQVVKPDKHRLDRRMKGAGADPQQPFK